MKKSKRQDWLIKIAKDAEIESPLSRRFFFTADSWATSWILYKANKLGVAPSQVLKILVNEAIDKDFKDGGKK